MHDNANVINWFEIPATDFERGKTFYETIFGVTMFEMPIGEARMAVFPTDQSKVGGAICQGEGYVPSQDGPILYLNGNPDLQLVLDRIPAAGGSIVLPKTMITEEIGFMAIFNDSEGNRVALHSNK